MQVVDDKRLVTEGRLMKEVGGFTHPKDVDSRFGRRAWRGTVSSVPRGAATPPRATTFCRPTTEQEHVSMRARRGVAIGVIEWLSPCHIGRRLRGEGFVVFGGGLTL